MRRSRWMNLCLIAVLTVVSLGSGVLAWAAPAPAGPAAPIAPDLQSALAAEGQANLIIDFREQADLRAAAGMGWEERGKYVVEALRAVADHSQAAVRAHLDKAGIAYQSFYVDNSIYVPGASLALANELAALPGVHGLRLEEVFPVPVPEPAREEAGITAVEWGVAKINADDAWGLGYTGQGIVVANVDTGVRYTHAALVNQYRGNLGGGQFSHTYSWYDPTGTYPSAPGDNNGHGTHTMGTIAGTDGGANQIGVAPGARWIACKGCSSSSCSSTALNACFQWMLAPGGDSSMRPNVVNNSWGGCSFSTTYRTSINSLRAAGIYPVFSAGNTSNCGYSAPFCGSIGSPGTYKEVTAVGSTTSSDTISSFSLWGPSTDTTAPGEIKPEVSAPGSSIRSSVNTGDTAYDVYSGTSMAAPHVAGALAVIWSACPTLKGNFDASEQLLKDSALKIAYATGCGNEGAGNIPNNAFGYGRIDVLAAVSSCGGPPPVPPSAPTDLVATAASSSQINLSWTDTSSNETGFEIERRVAGGSFAQIATVGANVQAYSNTGLQPSTTYEYQVRAVNAGGPSGYTNIASATTLAAPTMHTASITLTSVKVRTKFNVTAVVSIQDAGNAPVPGAVVSVRWTLPGNKAKVQTGTTTTGGTVSFTVSGGAGTYTITVTGATKSGWVWVPSSNDTKSITVQ